MTNKKVAVTFEANMDVSKVKQSVSDIQKVFNDISMTKGMSSSASGVFKKLLDELDNYNELTSQAATSMADIKKADKSLTTILGLIEKINETNKEIGQDPIKFIDPAELKKINAAKKAIEQTRQAISNTAIAAKKTAIQEQYNKAEKKAKELNGQVEVLNNKIAAKKATKSGIETQLENAKKDLAELRKELANLEANPVKLETKTTSKKGVKTTENLNTQEVEDYKNKLNDTKTRITELDNTVKQLGKDLQLTDTSKLEEELTEVSAKAKEAETVMLDLAEKLKHVTKDARAEALKKLRNEISDLTGVAKKDLPQSIDKLEEFVRGLEDTKKADVEAALRKIASGLKEIKGASEESAKGLREQEERLKQLTRHEQDIENLKNRILDFFSISNTIQLFRRAVNSAIDTVKEEVVKKYEEDNSNLEESELKELV